ncbi:uncharacterized protein LOC133886506 [Phragmites australis]|uniref:uncharacterized protein LOC133886506 n=1 Tax=Phragmites australis TaxID=29695 RepID=UPI002D76535C|nr:uncharacterized protein LOC133886506 [Phragmites australis]
MEFLKAHNALCGVLRYPRTSDMLGINLHKCVDSNLCSYPGAEGAVTGTRVRQSVLYSNRPRGPRHSQVPAPTEDHSSEVSRSELGRAVTDLPTFEALSLSDPPILTLRATEEHAGDVSSGELGPTVTVQSRSEALSVSVSSFTPQSTEEKLTKDPDDDTEEELRLFKEYFDARPCTSIDQAFDRIRASEHATLTALAAKWGREPPPPPKKYFTDDQETQSLQAQQQASAAAAHPQHCTAPREPRREASTEEIIENTKKWMHEEVMVVFKKYIEKRDDLMVRDYHLEELRHLCVNVEKYYKVFHHYNFTVRMKKANSADWTVALYFGEVKEIFGRKYYFCCPLEPNENGHCYACMNQGVEDLQHPATGGFDMGLSDGGFNFWYTDE